MCRLRQLRQLRWSCVAVITALSFVATVRAQEQINPDELNRKYQDALNQLKAAQDRKNELANENEKLKERMADVEKQLDEAKRQLAEHAQQTFRLRSQYAAWNNFIQRYPELAERWRAFLEADIFSIPSYVLEPETEEWSSRERLKLPRTTDAK